MFIFPADMRRSALVTDELKFTKLRHGYLQGISDATESCLLRLTIRASDLIKKVAPERVVPPAHGTIGFANKLRDQVEVPNRREEHCDLTEIPVDVDLLEVGLSKTFRVSQIVGMMGSLQQFLSVP
jgi:hypothetical protein